jgi:adenosine deaminase
MIHDAFARLPKAELHLHIEGTLEPELAFELALRNGVALPYADTTALRDAYEFTNLQTFLDIYYTGASVLRTERDFFDLADAYFRRARLAGVVHAELFFDPQAHASRGVPFAVVIEGLWAAVRASAERHGISSRLIMCFLRDRSVESAMETIDAALPFRDRITAVGLDSAEIGNPPAKFAAVFARARGLGWRVVAHAGEEGPPEYVSSALDELGAERIDHGIRSLEDPALVARLRAERIPLTVCPFSNVKLRVVDTIGDMPLPEMLAEGLCVTINSDDPAYFGGYIDDNYRALALAFGYDVEQLGVFARNSFEAAFISAEQRRRYLAQLDAALAL